MLFVFQFSLPHLLLPPSPHLLFCVCIHHPSSLPPFLILLPHVPLFITSQNPQTAIPKGTFLAIAITTVVYLVMAWAVGFVVIRNAPGEAQDFFGDLVNTTNQCLNGSTVALNFTVDETACGVEPYNFSANFPACNLSCGCEYCTTVECIYRDNNRSDLALLCSQGFASLTQRMCAYGLLNNFQVLTYLLILRGVDMVVYYMNAPPCSILYTHLFCSAMIIVRRRQYMDGSRLHVLHSNCIQQTFYRHSLSTSVAQNTDKIQL